MENWRLNRLTLWGWEEDGERGAGQTMIDILTHKHTNTAALVAAAPKIKGFEIQP